jgi:hypothetical protein
MKKVTKLEHLMVCGELLHMVYSPAAFPILKRRDKTRVLQGGNSLY